MNKAFLPMSALALTLAVVWTSFDAPATAEPAWSDDRRFKDNGNRTITDTQTQLMWMKQDSYLHSGNWINWFEANEFIQRLNEEGFADFNDWQVPTVEELTTLFEAGKTNSRVLGHGMVIHMDPLFAGEGSASLWSVEENGHFNAFGVVLNTGNRFNSSKKSRFQKAVRAVRRLN